MGYIICMETYTLYKSGQSLTALTPGGGQVDAWQTAGYSNRSGLSLAQIAGLVTGTAPSAVTRAA